MYTEQILAFLKAYPAEDVVAAYDLWVNGADNYLYEEVPDGEDLPAGRSWTIINGKRFVVKDGPLGFAGSHIVTWQSRNKNNSANSNLPCPICGETLYSQPVCSKCDKGKAGIRTQWVCGDNPNHIFYTE